MCSSLKLLCSSPSPPSNTHERRGFNVLYLFECGDLCGGTGGGVVVRLSTGVTDVLCTDGGVRLRTGVVVDVVCLFSLLKSSI